MNYSSYTLNNTPLLFASILSKLQKNSDLSSNCLLKKKFNVLLLSWKKCQESHVKNHSVSLLTCNCKDKWFTWSWKINVLFISIQSLCVFWDVFESYPHQEPWIEINMLTLISLYSFSFFSRLCYWIKHRFFFSDNKNHDFLMWMDY